MKILDYLARSDLGAYMDYKKFYDNFSAPFRPYAKLIVFLSNSITSITALAYIAAIAYAFFKLRWSYEGVFYKLLLIPALTFLLVTILRKIISRKRPYVAYEIKAFVAKPKERESFPSRHTVSIAIIASACLNVSLILGLILWILALFLGLFRVICGLHYPSDVICAYLIAILASMIYIWL